MFQDVKDWAQSLEWGLHRDIGHGITGIEELTNSFGSFDFINNEYLDMLHQYDDTIKILSGVVITCALLYTTLTDTKETPKLIQKIFFGLLGVALFIPIFSMAVGDVGGGIMNSMSNETADYGIGIDLINYTLKDYEAEEYHPNFETWEEIDSIDITEKLDEDVEKCTTTSDCKVVREKGEFRYEPSLLYGVIMGAVLFAMLLIACILLAKNCVELLLSGLIGLGASALSMVSPSAPFAKNYWNSLARQMGAAFLMVACLKGYMNIVGFMLDVYDSLAFNFIQSGLMFFIINVAVLWTILDGSSTIEKVFGIDAGISKTAAAVAGNQFARRLGSAGDMIGRKASEFGKNTLKNGSNTAANMTLGSIAGSLKGMSNESGTKDKMQGGFKGAKEGASEGAKVGKEEKKKETPSSEYRGQKRDEIKASLSGQNAGENENQQSTSNETSANSGTPQNESNNSQSLKQKDGEEKQSQQESNLANSSKLTGENKSNGNGKQEIRQAEVNEARAEQSTEGSNPASGHMEGESQAPIQTSSGDLEVSNQKEPSGATVNQERNSTPNESRASQEPFNNTETPNPFEGSAKKNKSNNTPKSYSKQRNEDRLFNIENKSKSSRRGRR
ncbi:hypothetical protein R2F61_07080 [Mollicutes bacterium LVI A0078]|nr:hypothetical protein RZE84_07085 [Mollicutes bacterium LVI A0075]WOO90487.1 hypothetical protein R2F61_07080 [Mollicutes bacterium LVI A0078]